MAAAVLGSAGPAFAQSSGATQPAPSRAVPNKTACDADGHWPGYIQGRPDGFDARDDGVYLWHNPEGGWGLRVSHPVLPGQANKVVFSGTLTSKGGIGDVKRIRDEKDDRVKVGKHGHTLSFRFVNYGGVDGVDFTTGCTPGVRVSLKVDNATVPVRFVHLGDKKVNPQSDPFTIRRRDRDDSTK